ncbi:MAG: hypothetical protein RSG57_05960, partial [Christensenellaceae bacterium]
MNNIKDISQAVEALKQVYPDLQGEVLQKQSGYVGYHLTISGTGGINSEIQIATPESLRIKKIDDEFYQKWRNVDEKSMTDAQKKEHLKDKAFTQKLWKDYYAGFTPDVISKASSSVKGLESIQVPMTPWNAAQLPSKNSNISNTSEDGTMASNLPPSVKPYSMSAIDNTPPVSDNITPKDENVNGNESIADADIMTADFDSLTPRQQAQRVIFKGEYLSEAHIHKSIQPVMVKEAAEWAKYRDEARQILPAVESAQKNLVNNLHKAVDGLGFEVIDPAPKSAESTADKIYRKRNNEGIVNYSIASIKDHTRASVIVNNIKDISQAVEALKQVYPD